VTRTSACEISALLVLAVQVQAPAFSFAGVSLRSDFRAVAARYPHSTPQSEYVLLAPEDVRDHISAIEVSGSGATRRVRVSFETQGTGSEPEYPRCATIESKVSTQFGRPQEIRRFMEEASPRADRIWRSETEELALLCFSHHGHLWAEAVHITPRDRSP
jgi:hypothetical protein